MIQKFKADILIITGILFIAILIMIVPGLFFKNNIVEVVVTQGRTEIGRYSLLQNETFTVTDSEGGYNLIMINEGTVQVTDADCPDKLCVKQRAINGYGESIICLPHKLVIQISSGKESGIDAMTH